ncbi:MAG: hypothetical protein PHO08_16005 [Methylococcales bacterium]|nr:hypothetical protein [Methylococcales bacterium]
MLECALAAKYRAGKIIQSLAGLFVNETEVGRSGLKSCRIGWVIGCRSCCPSYCAKVNTKYALEKEWRNMTGYGDIRRSEMSGRAIAYPDLQGFHKENLIFESEDDKGSMAGSINKLTLSLLGAFASFERDLIRRRNRHCTSQG